MIIETIGDHFLKSALFVLPILFKTQVVYFVSPVSMSVVQKFFDRFETVSVGAFKTR